MGTCELGCALLLHQWNFVRCTQAIMQLITSFKQVLPVMLLLLVLSGCSSRRTSNCERAVLNCCDQSGRGNRLPMRCFELNRCAGLFMVGCSPLLYNKAMVAISG